MEFNLRPTSRNNDVDEYSRMFDFEGKQMLTLARSLVQNISQLEVVQVPHIGRLYAIYHCLIMPADVFRSFRFLALDIVLDICPAIVEGVALSVHSFVQPEMFMPSFHSSFNLEILRRHCRIYLPQDLPHSVVFQFRNRMFIFIRFQIFGKALLPALQVDLSGELITRSKLLYPKTTWR